MLGFLKRKKKEEDKNILCWCPYHDTFVGWVDFEERRRTIRRTKPDHEIETRLRELVPVKNTSAVMFTLCRGMSDFALSYWRRELERMHKDEVPSTVWDGKKLVFPKRIES